MPVHTPHPSPRLAALGAAATTLLLVSGCASWTSGEADAPRASVSLSAPSSIQRPEWLQRQVVKMDAEAFPAGGLTLKLSYQLSPSAAPAVVAQRAAGARSAAGG